MYQAIKRGALSSRIREESVVLVFIDRNYYDTSLKMYFIFVRLDSLFILQAFVCMNFSYHKITGKFAAHKSDKTCS